jgi:hypothetical protein
MKVQVPRRHQRIMLWGAAVVVAALILFPNYFGLLHGSPAQQGVPDIVCQAAGCCAAFMTDDAGRDPKEQANKTAVAIKADHEGQIVFRVDGLTCRAVRGLGCGHKIEPVLTRLNKAQGTASISVNRTGTMLRISVAAGADESKVAEEVRQALTKENHRPVLIAGDELKRALMNEEWRSPGDLSAIEFRTFAFHRVKTFAENEKLSKQVTDSLTKIAERQWDRIAKEAGCCVQGANRPADWVRRYNEFATGVCKGMKPLLTTEQAGRLRQLLSRPFEERNMPLAAEGRSQ